MSFKSRGEDQEAVWGLVRLCAAIAIIICVSVGACSMKRMEEISSANVSDLKGACKYQATREVADGLR
jgi:hypothetical protein